MFLPDHYVLFVETQRNLIILCTVVTINSDSYRGEIKLLSESAIKEQNSITMSRANEINTKRASPFWRTMQQAQKGVCRLLQSLCRILHHLCGLSQLLCRMLRDGPDIAVAHAMKNEKKKKQSKYSSPRTIRGVSRILFNNLYGIEGVCPLEWEVLCQFVSKHVLLGIVHDVTSILTKSMPSFLR